MKLFLATFVCLAAITISVYQQDILREYMQAFLRTSGLRSITKTLTRSVATDSTSSTMSPSSTFVGLPVIPPEDPSLNATSPKPRAIQKVFEAIEQAEGAGATVRRSIGTPRLRNFTPFLMLDHFNVAVGAGFPDRKRSHHNLKDSRTTY